MTLANGIKKLSKLGEVTESNGIYSVENNGVVVEFARNGRIENDYPICCIRVYSKKDSDDNMTDYSAGVWCKTLTQAFKKIELYK